MPGSLPAGGVTSSLTDGDEYWPTPTTAPTFSGFAFMFWSVAYDGKSSVPNYYSTKQTIPYPVKISGSAVQIWAWYTPIGGTGGTGTPQVWIDAFDVSIGNFSNDPKVVTVSPDSGGTLTTNANSQGVVPTSSSSENILAYSKLMDGAVFDSWGYIFGPTTPPVTVDKINPMQLDASQNAGTSGPAYWLAFYKTPPKPKDKESKEKEWRIDKNPWEEKSPKEHKDTKETGPELPPRTTGSADLLASSETIFRPSERIDSLEGQGASGRSFIRPEERPRVQGPSSEEMKS